ncbi:hypothetical protein BH10ACI3_BH10ACI3_07330 [soil metagenome]
MKRTIASLVVASALSIGIAAQTSSGPKQPVPQKPAIAAVAVAVGPANAPLDMAKATLAAHGGEKLKKLKSLVIKGSVDMNVFNQQMPGAFSTAIAGEKYYFEINSMQSLKQVYDGQQTYSSIQGFSLPPITSLGFPVLIHIGDTGYVVAALPEGVKKRKGFRVTTPEGFYTDFLIEDKTSQIKGFESSYEVSGRVVTTSVEVDEFQTVEGVLVPSKYSQRFDLGQMTAYANFKAKSILVNSTVEDSAFAIPK